MPSFTRLLLLLLMSMTVLPWVGAPAARAAPVPVAPGVFVQRDSFAPGRQPDGNSVLFVGPRGIVVVDSGRHIEHTQALLDFAAAQQRPLLALVNTHWHLDHLGGNALLRAQVPGLQVLASEAVASALAGWLADSRRQMQGLLDGGTLDVATQAMVRVDIALIDHGPKLLPNTVVKRPQALALGGLDLQIGHVARAVTAADLWVADAASGVLAAGDLVTLPVPFLDTACPEGWRRALGQLAAQPFTTLVPGHGAPMSRADFATWRGAFEALLACAASDAPAGTCAQGWADALGPLLPAAERRRADGMLAYYLQQHLRAGPAQRERYCAASG